MSSLIYKAILYVQILWIFGSWIHHFKTNLVHSDSHKIKHVQDFWINMFALWGQNIISLIWGANLKDTFILMCENYGSIFQTYGLKTEKLKVAFFDLGLKFPSFLKPISRFITKKMCNSYGYSSIFYGL